MRSRIRHRSMARRSHLGLVASLAALGVSLAAPRPACARDAAAAEGLYRTAKEAAKRGDWATACAQLAESQRLDPAPGTLLNLADCEEHRGQLAGAWQHFLQAETQFKAGDSRALYARKRADALEKRVPRVIVRLAADAPPGAKIFRDDEEVGSAALGVPLPVETGSHTIVVRLGSAESRTAVQAEEGRVVEIVVQAPSPPATAGAPAWRATPPLVLVDPSSGARPPSPGAASKGSRRAFPDRRAIGWVLLATGAAGVAVGAVTGVIALGDAQTVKARCGADYATCDAQAVDAAHRGKLLSGWTPYLIGGGTILAGTGVYFVLSTSGAQAEAASRAAATRVGVGPQGASVVGTF